MCEENFWMAAGYTLSCGCVILPSRNRRKAVCVKRGPALKIALHKHGPYNSRQKGLGEDRPSWWHADQQKGEAVNAGYRGTECGNNTLKYPQSGTGQKVLAASRSRWTMPLPYVWIHWLFFQLHHFFSSKEKRLKVLSYRTLQKVSQSLWKQTENVVHIVRYRIKPYVPL